MRTEENREKQLYCRMFSANDRLQSLRGLYNETGSRRYLGPMAQANKDLKKVVDELSQM